MTCTGPPWPASGQVRLRLRRHELRLDGELPLLRLYELRLDDELAVPTQYLGVISFLILTA